jgi:hypothetical protein
MDEKEIESLVASVTPERIRRLALEVEARQPKINRGTAPLFEVLDELTLDLPLRAASERSSLEVRLRAAVLQAVAQIEGLTFVEGDG